MPFSAQHNDLLHPLLTVYETLFYTAMLRLPRMMSKKEKASRVDAVVAALGLERCKDRLIGGTSILSRHKSDTISGGERKRVSIGVEILLNPNAILLGDSISAAMMDLNLLHLCDCNLNLPRCALLLCSII